MKATKRERAQASWMETNVERRITVNPNWTPSASGLATTPDELDEVLEKLGVIPPKLKNTLPPVIAARPKAVRS